MRALPVSAATVLVLLCACENTDEPVTPLHVTAAASWTAADGLFHRGDPGWLGADGAYSIELGEDRVLWLFGDTFVATSAADQRSESRLVRNTVAIQDGGDPTTASFAPVWGGMADLPVSFYPEQGDRWHWPLHGVRLPDGPLVLFWSILRAAPGDGLGFAGDGWRVTIVDDPSGPPATWMARTVDPPGADFDAVVGTAVALDGDRVLALATADAGSHATYLARWPRAALAAGELAAIEWWQDGGFVAGAGLVGAPEALFAEGATEASLHHDAGLGLWIYVFTRGFGSTTVAIRSSPAPEGPWSAPLEVFTPPESLGSDPFVYAAKGHRELGAPGRLVVTYATNSFEFGDLFTADGSRDLYWPRFVTIDLTR